MSVITGLARPKSTIEAAASPIIHNVSALLADTEYSLALTNTSVKSFLIRVRGIATLKFSFNTGESGSNYITVPPGCSYEAVGLAFSGELFFQTNKPAMIVEVIEWG